jgi:hypothetical protein
MTHVPVPPILRSILAIAAGFLAIGALAFGTGAALHAAGISPAPSIDRRRTTS